MQMKRDRFTVALGMALVVQFITSLVSSVAFFDPLIAKDDIGKTMWDIAQNQTQAHIGIFMDIITAVVIVWLGVLFFRLLRRMGQVFATTALVLYIIEAVMLVVSRIFGYSLIQLSIAYGTSGDKSLEIFGQILLYTKDFAGSMGMIPFGIGAVLFYYLLFKSKALHSWIPLWGLIAVIAVPISVPLMAYGVTIPFFVNFPYVPFELFTGVYILIKGLSVKSLEDNMPLS
jgi:hypothetical protein